MSFGIGVTMPSGGPGHVLEHFGQQSEEGAYFSRRVVGRIFSYMRPFWKQIIVAVVAMLFATGLTLLTPYLVKVIIDQYIAPGDSAGLTRFSLITAAAFCRSVHRHGDTAILPLLGGAAGNCQPAGRSFPPASAPADGLPRHAHCRRHRLARDQRCRRDQRLAFPRLDHDYRRYPDSDRHHRRHDVDGLATGSAYLHCHPDDGRCYLSVLTPGQDRLPSDALQCSRRRRRPGRGYLRQCASSRPLPRKGSRKGASTR